MSDKFASTIHIYDQYAAQFAQHFENKLDTTELDVFLKLIPKKGSILDAGCGTARDSAYCFKKGFKVLGIDVSKEMLVQAHKLHPEVHTQHMSLTNITLPESEFDGIWCKAALLHIDRESIPKVLRSFHRILKNNGTLFIQTKAGEGEGTQPIPFDPTLTRFFTFFSMNEMSAYLEKGSFKILNKYTFNSKERKIGARDQEWIVVFAQKANVQ